MATGQFREVYGHFGTKTYWYQYRSALNFTCAKMSGHIGCAPLLKFP